MSAILESLKHFRKLKGFTQEDLRKRTGIPQSHISRIEAGDIDIRLSSLEEIVRLLDMELVLVPRALVPVVEDFLGRKEMNNEKSPWVPDEEEE